MASGIGRAMAKNSKRRLGGEECRSWIDLHCHSRLWSWASRDPRLELLGCGVGSLGGRRRHSMVVKGTLVRGVRVGRRQS